MTTSHRAHNTVRLLLAAVIAGGCSNDTTGHFRMSYLSPSTRWVAAGWVYNLVADAPSMTSFLPVTLKGVTVVAPSETPLGGIVLP